MDDIFRETTMKRILTSLILGAALLTTPVLASAQDDAKEILARYKTEPTVEATMEAALEYAGITTDRLDSLYSRAQGSRALPKKVYYEYTGRFQDTDRPQEKTTLDEAGNPKSVVQTKYKQDQDYDQHKVRAEWELSGLVYNSDMLNVYKAMSSTAKDRDKLLKDVTKIYYARRKHQITMDTDTSADVITRLDQEIKLQELTAQLDAYTGGWFSKQLKNR